LGFLFTFGSAGSLSNIIAGLILTYMRLFKIGDRVKIGVVGDVIEKSLLVTRIRTIKTKSSLFLTRPWWVVIRLITAVILKRTYYPLHHNNTCVGKICIRPWLMPQLKQR
jgi:uncharacterized membrane protein